MHAAIGARLPRQVEGVRKVRLQGLWHGCAVAALVQDQEPAMIHFGIYLDPDTGEATTVQVHRSVDNFARHMDLVTPMMAEARELIDLSEMTIRVYGEPTEPIVEQMRSLAGAGASVSIAQLAAGADHVG